MKKLRTYAPTHRRFQAGFTIIELLVAMTLFVIITTVAVTSFIRSLRAQQAIVGLISINDNASLTLEQMSREIRVGHDFSAVGESTLQFKKGPGSNAVDIVYQLNNTTHQIERREGSVLAVPLTAANVRIAKLHFLVLTEDANRVKIAPRIVVAMSVGSFARDLKETYTNIQTTLSPRLLNF